MHTSGGLEVRLIGGLVVFAVMALMLLVGIANITGFTFREVAEHARALLFAQVLFVVVWLIEKFEVPLPIRLENTWPFMLGAAWSGIHALLVMKAQSDGVAGMGFGTPYPEDWVDLPWYAGNACLIIVFAVLVTAGYVVRSKRLRDNW